MALSHTGRTLYSSFGVLCSILIGSTAIAGSLSTTNRALNDGFGPDGGRWRGSVTVSGAAFGDTIVAEVDWAAFGPGKFQLYLNDEAIAQTDPSGPNEVTYVYQITSISSASPSVDTLTVGLDASDGRGSVVAPSFVPAGGANEGSPSGGGDNNTSMAWFFNGPGLGVGDTSSLLVFTSPFAPELDFLQANAGLAGPVVSPLVASPSDRLYQFDVPEPNSLVLLMASTVVAFCTRKSR